MYSGQGYHTLRQDYTPQQNARSASPSKPSPPNSLITRIRSSADASPAYPPQNTFNPRPPMGPSATHGPAPVGQQHTEEAQNGDGVLPSEETVDAFLASVLTTDVVASRLQAPSAPAARPSAPPAAVADAHPVAYTSASVPTAHLPGSSAPTTQPTPATHSDAALLSSARALLLPHLLANARARDLGGGGGDGQWEGPRAAEVERRALELATDEWCAEMIAHARRAREEMRRRASEEAEGQQGSDGEQAMSMDVDSAAGAETDDMGADGVARCAKAGTGEDAREDLGVQDVRMGTPEEVVDSDMGEREAEDAQERPVPPGETMLDSAARVLQDFLTNTPRPRSAVRDEAPASSVQPHTAGSSTNNDPAPATEEVAPRMTAPDTGSGLWAIRVGSRVPEIVTVTFNLHESVASAAQRWARRHTELDRDASHIWVHLLCLPALAVAEANSSLGASAGSAAIADALWDIQTQWPPKGTLIVEVNGGDPAHARTFLPIHLETTGGPVDLTPHVRPGANTIRLIQLRNLSEWVFVVHADVPDDDERAPFTAPDAEAQEWAAFVARASARHGAIVSTPVAVAVAPV